MREQVEERDGASGSNKSRGKDEDDRVRGASQVEVMAYRECVLRGTHAVWVDLERWYFW